MRNTRLAWPLVLAALGAPPAHSQTEWKASGSGADMTLTLESQATASLDVRTGKSVTRPKLILKCHDHKPMVGIFIGSLNQPSATVRFDREPAFKADLHNRTKWGKLWMTSTVIDPETKFFAGPAEIAAAFLRHKTMLVRVTPANRPSQEVTFELPELLPQLAAFEQACGLEKPIERPSVAAAATQPAAAPAAAPAIEKFGEWRQSLAASKLDDRPIVLLSLPQANESSLTKSASLVLRCREKTTDAFLSFGFPLFGARGAYLAVRASADGGPEAKEWWLSPSTDGVVYFFGSAPQLLKRLLASRELKLAYRPKKRPENYTWMPQGEAVFTLAGLDQASKPYLEACPVDMAKVKVKDGLPPLP